jgi:AraC family transcriptional regulator, transcriptional activator of pobA
MKTIPVKSIQLQGHQTNGFDGFKIRSISEVIAGKDMNQDLHRHDFYFILVARKGSGMHAIDFIEHKVKTNAIFMLRPGQVHKLQLKAGSEGYLLEFSKDFQFLSKTGNELLRKATNRNYCQLDKMGTGALCAILQTMLEEFRARQEGFENVIKANLEVFFIQYLRYRQQDQGTDNNKANHYQQEKLQEFLDLLEVNINSEKHASAYADMVSLSPFQLNSITKNLLGKTVAELIEDQILLEAKRYLLATSNQVNQIAFQLGYEDVSYFIRFFKKLTGHTPEAFRKNFR